MCDNVAVLIPLLYTVPGNRYQYCTLCPQNVTTGTYCTYQVDTVYSHRVSHQLLTKSFPIYRLDFSTKHGKVNILIRLFSIVLLILVDLCDIIFKSIYAKISIK